MVTNLWLLAYAYRKQVQGYIYMHAHSVIQTLLLREAHPALPPVLPVTDGVLLKSAPSLHAFRFNFVLVFAS